MSNWQEWVVALLLLLCVWRIGRTIYSFIHKANQKKGPCNCCSGSCCGPVRHSEKKHTSDENSCQTKKNKKSCCG